MSEYEILTLAVSIVAVILIPLCILAIRGIVKWTRVEDKLDHLIERMSQLVEDKDKVHREIVGQMREDRKATNERLQWLERNLWGKIT